MKISYRCEISLPIQYPLLAFRILTFPPAKVLHGRQVGQCLFLQELYEMSVWPHQLQINLCPPSAGVLHFIRSKATLLMCLGSFLLSMIWSLHRRRTSETSHFGRGIISPDHPEGFGYYQTDVLICDNIWPWCLPIDAPRAFGWFGYPLPCLASE